MSPTELLINTDKKGGGAHHVRAFHVTVVKVINCAITAKSLTNLLED